MLNKTLLANLAQDTASAFCIDFTNSTIDGSVKISTNTQNSFNYSIDNTNYDQLANAGDTISVPKGSKLYMRGVNKVGNLFTSWNKQWNAWTITGNNVKLSGNIQDLLNDSDNDTITKSYAFSYLFYHNTAIINASNLILPATNLADHCYESMFDACTSLISAPKLPASTLADYCYSAMFRDCTSLTVAPELPATTLADYCYNYMFSGCTSLTTAPELPATTLASNCYRYMFYNTSLTSAPELPATTLANSCYTGMFQGCTGLTSAPELPITTIAYECYAYMFAYCTSLTSAPELPAMTLTNYCYNGMFKGCTSLTIAPKLPATTLASNCYSSMFQDCTSLTVAPELPVTNLADFCYYSTFRGCTSLTTAPELPATTLARYCYSYMFRDCTSLTSAPELLATTLTDYCYQYMFDGCTNLNHVKCLATDISASSCTSNWLSNVSSTGTFVKNPSMNNWTIGANGIPSGWIVQDYTPPFCIDFTNSTTDGSVTISANTQNSFNYSIDNESYNQLANAGDTISVPQGSKLYMKGVNKVASLFTRNASLNAWTVTGDNVKLSGNIQDLLNDGNNDTLTGQYTFIRLFSGNVSIVDATELILPATSLARSCYGYMFDGCSNLTAAPELPATTLASGCYSCMFTGCTRLTTAPHLPATTLVSGCYSFMFEGCSSLTTAPELPATTLADKCCQYMFEGCSSLTTAPELPATTLADYCYRYMFYGCSKLNYVKCLATNISAINCTNSWLHGVSSTGTFVKNSAMNSWNTGEDGIPSGWTVQNA